MSASSELDKLRRRHPNAAGDTDTVCMQSNDDFRCTRASGHEGDHEAHGMFGNVVHRWANPGR